jgi:hypothetical protein
MEIYGIFNNMILQEGRLEDAQAKYPDVDIQQLSQGDPSGNNKYLMWMAKLANEAIPSNREERINTLITTVQGYHENLAKIDNNIGDQAGVGNPKDINAFRTLDQLQKVVELAEAKETASSAKKDAIEIYNKNGFVVHVPLTVQASCRIGGGTRWCIASGSGNNTHFDSYSKNAIFYFVRNNNIPQFDVQNSSGNKWSKVAIQKNKLSVNNAGNETFWDATDSSHSTPPSEWPADIMETVRAYHGKAEKQILDRKLKNLKSNPEIQEYINLGSYLKEDEKKWVLYKLIKKDVLALNNAKIYTTLREMFNEDDMYKLFRELKSVNTEIKGLNNDSKIVFKKFSRSDEQIKAQDTTSFYLFLGVDGENGFRVEKIEKLDPNEPESHKRLSALKLKSKFTNNKLFGIRTEVGLLDQYVGKTSDELDPSVMDSIKGKMMELK